MLTGKAMRRLEIPLQLLLLASVFATPVLSQQAEPAEKPQTEEPAEEAPPEPRRGGGKILLPGAGAYDPPAPSSPRSSPPVVPPPADQRSLQPSEQPPPDESKPATASEATGDLFWSGRIYKNGRIRISVDNQTTAGYVEGDALPGVPVTVDARSPIVEIIEQPNARNGYKSFEFQVKKTRKEPVSFNFHWVRK